MNTMNKIRENWGLSIYWIWYPTSRQIWDRGKLHCGDQSYT